MADVQMGTYIAEDDEDNFFKELVKHQAGSATRAATGEEILDALNASSSSTSSIKLWVHAQHGWRPNSPYGNSVEGGFGGGSNGLDGTGFYGIDPPTGANRANGGRNLADLKAMVDAGDIVFSSDSTTYVYGCEVSNTKDFAKKLSTITGGTVRAGVGKVSTAHANGSNGNATDPWRAEGGWDTYENGTKVNTSPGPKYIL